MGAVRALARPGNPCRNIAECRGIGTERDGTLAAGKRADFIVLDANPLDDIRNARRIDSVYLRGLKLNREALLAKWKQVGKAE